MEHRKMSIIDFRLIFQEEVLPDLFLNYIDLFFFQINHDKELEFLNIEWNQMIAKYNHTACDYPNKIKSQLINDEINNRYYFLITMPKISTNNINLAIYIMVSFGSHKNDVVRYFLGETNSDNIDKEVYVSEIKYKDCIFNKVNYGVLKSNANDSKRNEPKYFIKSVMQICNDN